MKSLATVAGLCVAWLLSGCAGGEQVREDHSVSGTVTFNGEPVTEGTIQFEDATKGLGGSGELDSDGSYLTSLPDGDYKVTILPPMELQPDSANSPGGMVAKSVKNIPPKYQSGDKSPLAAKVSAEQLVHNFDMMP
jgi:hypothetical protein